MIIDHLPDYSSFDQIITDSRFFEQSHNAIFFAIKGLRHDGHKFISDLYGKGVRKFVIEKASMPNLDVDISALDADFFLVENAIVALQTVIAQKRASSKARIVAVAGSNGKTIVKEWLHQLISADFKTVKSPRSYNSQIGVALSVFQLEKSTEVGVFEAGISQPDEMAKLELMIQPEIGIFTNIGAAHNEGFRSTKQKISEKLRLFTKSKTLIYCADHESLNAEINIILRSVNPNIRLIGWQIGQDVFYESSTKNTIIKIVFNEETLAFEVPFHDAASLENATNAILAALHLGLNKGTLQKRTTSLRPVAMRMSLKEGLNDALIVDDTYNNDYEGLAMAMNFMAQQGQNKEKVLIISDFKQIGTDQLSFFESIKKLCLEKGISKIYAIGPDFLVHRELFKRFNIENFENVNTFLAAFKAADFNAKIILVKGARVFELEKIVSRLEKKSHGTVLEINLDALTNNLNVYRQKASGAKIMAMVKAFAYGAGSIEVAELLQYHRVDYLAVAYLDEGVFLRNNGITLPIMVMNPGEGQFEIMKRFNLEPEIYSIKTLNAYLDAPEKPAKVHIKLDTGMHRLGFESHEIEILANSILEQKMEIATVFSHLSSADDAQHKAFTLNQIKKFTEDSEALISKINQRPLRHLANSPGIMAYPSAKFDMVRLGIGLYGVDPTTENQKHLKTVATLKTVISQIKTLPAGTPIGYSQRGVLNRESRIATLAIGYADGYDRRFSRGVGKVLINGQLCPVVGNVCMDMTMVDVTDAHAQEGSEAVIFGETPSIIDLAGQIGTISYEILSGVSERVKRVFIKE